jgi:hypothetical protein
MIGTKIKKFFPKCHGNPTPGWFNGKVVDVTYDDESGVQWYHVLYDDGDGEHMTAEQLLQTFLGRHVAKLFGHQVYHGTVNMFTAADPEKHGKYDVNLWKVTYEDGDEEECSFEELQRILFTEESPLPPASLVPDTSSADIVIPPQTAKAPYTLHAPSAPALLFPGQAVVVPIVPPDQAPRVTNIAFHNETRDRETNLARAEQVVDIKCEALEEAFLAKKEKKRKRGGDSLENLPPDRRIKRHAWIQANTDPRTGEGRVVFRRAVGPLGPTVDAGIVSLLGGNAMDPWPVVKKALSEFVQENEFFVAGRGDYNPWGPRYAGEDGLLNIEAFSETQYQGGATNQVFHLFEQCHKTPEHPHYQGPNARGAYFYAGKYRRIVGGDIIEEIVAYDRLGLEETRWAIAEWAQRRTRCSFVDRNGNLHNVECVTQHHYDMAQAAYEDEWEGWTETKQEVAAYVEMFMERKYVIRTVAIECVGYDEELYDRLVEIGASKGQLSVEHASLGSI